MINTSLPYWPRRSPPLGNGAAFYVCLDASTGKREGVVVHPPVMDGNNLAAPDPTPVQPFFCPP